MTMQRWSCVSRGVHRTRMRGRRCQGAVMAATSAQMPAQRMRWAETIAIEGETQQMRDQSERELPGKSAARTTAPPCDERNNVTCDCAAESTTTGAVPMATASAAQSPDKEEHKGCRGICDPHTRGAVVMPR